MTNLRDLLINESHVEATHAYPAYPTNVEVLNVVRMWGTIHK